MIRQSMQALAATPGVHLPFTSHGGQKAPMQRPAGVSSPARVPFTASPSERNPRQRPQGINSPAAPFPTPLLTTKRAFTPKIGLGLRT